MSVKEAEFYTFKKENNTLSILTQKREHFRTHLMRPALP